MDDDDRPSITVIKTRGRSDHDYVVRVEDEYGVGERECENHYGAMAAVTQCLMRLENPDLLDDIVDYFNRAPKQDYGE